MRPTLATLTHQGTPITTADLDNAPTAALCEAGRLQVGERLHLATLPCPNGRPAGDWATITQTHTTTSGVVSLDLSDPDGWTDTITLPLFTPVTFAPATHDDAQEGTFTLPVLFSTRFDPSGEVTTSYNLVSPEEDTPEILVAQFNDELRFMAAYGDAAGGTKPAAVSLRLVRLPGVPVAMMEAYEEMDRGPLLDYLDEERGIDLEWRLPAVERAVTWAARGGADERPLWRTSRSY